MATGSVVFHFQTPTRFVEFFETALQDGVHLVRLNPIEDGSFNDVTGKQDVHPAAGFVCHHHDCSPLLIHWCAAVPRIKAAVEASVGLQEQAPIGKAGQQFMNEQLTMEGVHCYWLGALQRYADIYFR
jgi:hypothetical protein